MPKFDSVAQAFAWFWENVYPDLSVETKKTLRHVKYDYSSQRRNFSEKRMKKILSDHGFFKVQYIFDPTEEKEEN
ncbi:MAG TPA: hypothetical protein DCS93_28375 [Microscillaceae bacterium]|nr:hypothetical protein [Microscillaceae bacterium]